MKEDEGKVSIISRVVFASLIPLDFRKCNDGRRFTQQCLFSLITEQRLVS